MYIFNIYYFIGPFQKLDMIEFFMAHSSNIFLISSRVIFRIMRGFTFYHTHALMPDLYTYS